MNKDIETRRPFTPAVSAESLLIKAVESGQPIDVIERLLALRERINAEQALAEYTRAMLAFQSQCPPIQKTKAVVNRDGSERYRYAPIEEIRRVIDPVARANGFAITMDTDPTGNPGGVTIIVKVSHIGGHTERHSFYCPRQAEEKTKFGTFIMTDPQREESALTFGTRICLRNAFGITTGLSDDNTEILNAPRAESGPQRRDSGARQVEAQPIGEGALKRKIEASVTEYGLDPQGVKDWLFRSTGVMSFEELTEQQAERLFDRIPRFAARKLIREVPTMDRALMEDLGASPPTWMTDKETSELTQVISDRLKEETLRAETNEPPPHEE